MPKENIIWGVSALFHDAGISVIRDNQLIFGAHAERYSGIKHDKQLNYALLKDAIKHGHPDHVVWYERPWKKRVRQILSTEVFYGKWYPSPKKYLYNLGIRCPVTFVDHHYAHACAGAYTSNYSRAIVVVIDAIGEMDTCSVWEYSRDLGLFKKWSVKYPTSIGLLYSAFTKRCGLKPMHEEYITMGMAAWGKPIYAEQIKKDFIKSYHPFKMKRNVHKGIANYLPDADPMDLAASIQQIAEEFIIDFVQRAVQHHGDLPVVYQGGVALNCVANTKLLDICKHGLWIMPNPGDCGSSLGAALSYGQKPIKWPGPYIGTDIAKPYPVDACITELSTNKMVGIANGRAEFGPRALGHRSLLADPRGHDIKDKVNAIKRRQKFRPFAPAILEEYLHDYFDINVDRSPYMQYVGQCKKPNDFPAIVHVDGTSRIQTVGKNDCAGFRRLLERWHAHTGCPMLLNTSLNIKGKPMINTRQDADKFEHEYGVKVVS